MRANVARLTAWRLETATGEEGYRVMCTAEPVPYGSRVSLGGQEVCEAKVP